MKSIKVHERKLGREKAHGQAIYGENIIEIDPRQSSRERLDSLLHEYFHLAFPDWSESRVIKHSRKATQIIWRDNWRRVY